MSEMVVESPMNVPFGLNEEAHPVWSNETYKKWKKNSRYLYDTLLATEMEWPSLSVEWFPSKKSQRGDDVRRLLIGTQSAGDTNYIQIMKVATPASSLSQINADSIDMDRKEVGIYGTEVRFEMDIRIVHEGEVNRCRINPNNKYQIATKAPNADILVFDYSKHPSEPKDLVSRPNFRCKGHDKEGFALCWDPHSEGRILSGSNDAKICVWDLTQTQSSSGSSSAHVLQPTFSRQAHLGDIEDVDWHKFYINLFGSVDDAGTIMLWDPRVGGSVGDPRVRTDNAHGDDAGVKSLSFNPFNEYLLATGSSNGKIALWDLRNMKKAFDDDLGDHAHDGPVDKVCWSPTHETILASSSCDKTLKIWDLSQRGNEISDESAEDGPAELLFNHVGHTNEISDFAWSKDEPWFLASVDANNYMQVWQMDQAFRSERSTSIDIPDSDIE